LPAGCIPPDVQALSLKHEGVTTLNWAPQAAGTHYDVISGELLELQVNGGIHDAGCMANGLFSAEWEDVRPTFPVGAGIYYLVRAQNDCGSGSYGLENPPIERAPGACP